MLHFDIEISQPAATMHFIFSFFDIRKAKNRKKCLPKIIYIAARLAYYPNFFVWLLAATASVARKLNDQKFANQIETSVIEFDVNKFERCVKCLWLGPFNYRTFRIKEKLKQWAVFALAECKWWARCVFNYCCYIEFMRDNFFHHRTQYVVITRPNVWSI